MPIALPAKKSLTLEAASSEALDGSARVAAAKDRYWGALDSAAPTATGCPPLAAERYTASISATERKPSSPSMAGLRPSASAAKRSAYCLRWFSNEMAMGSLEPPVA